MPSPKEILAQINSLTADLVGLSLCDRQNFPSLRHLGKKLCEIGFGESGNVSNALKNTSYQDIFKELVRSKSYNLKMLDGALIQMMYRFRDYQLEAYRLAFFPSPTLEEFQNNPEIYLEDELYAEVVMKNIVPFPLRFDFDCREEVAVVVDHPKSHLTLGQYQNCRIPVSAPLTPRHFIEFILRSFYNTAFRKYSSQLSNPMGCFEMSITEEEMKLLYVQIPGRQIGNK